MTGRGPQWQTIWGRQQQQVMQATAVDENSGRQQRGNDDGQWHWAMTVGDDNRRECRATITAINGDDRQ